MCVTGFRSASETRALSRRCSIQARRACEFCRTRLQPDNYAATDRQNVYGYGSGVKITGVIANARVTVGGAAIAAPIPIQLHSQRWVL